MLTNVTCPFLHKTELRFVTVIDCMPCAKFRYVVSTRAGGTAQTNVDWEEAMILFSVCTMTFEMHSRQSFPACGNPLPFICVNDSTTISYLTAHIFILNAV